jgi:UDP-N-acetylglucosamine 4,6-dehydratase
MTRFSITLEQGVDFVLNRLGAMQGGEVFVPKIPSLRVAELARMMAPNLRQKIVGLRPGEKLHEVMCPQDESHQTLEFSRHYVIQPAVRFETHTDFSRDFSGEIGVPVADGFEYSSDKNGQWLEGEALLQMVQHTEHEE